MTARAAWKSVAAAAALMTLCGAAPAWAAFDAALPYPAEVALSEVGDKGYVFVRFPGAQRLYTYDQDRAGRSFCNEGCDSAHPVGRLGGLSRMPELRRRRRRGLHRITRTGRSSTTGRGRRCRPGST